MALSTGPTVGMNSSSPAMNPRAKAAFTSSSSSTTYDTVPIATMATSCVTSHLRSTFEISASTMRVCARDVAGTMASIHPRYTSGSAPMYMARKISSTNAPRAASVFETNEKRYLVALPSPSPRRRLMASVGDSVAAWPDGGAAVPPEVAPPCCAAPVTGAPPGGTTAAIEATGVPVPAAEEMSDPSRPPRLLSIHVCTFDTAAGNSCCSCRPCSTSVGAVKASTPPIAPSVPSTMSADAIPRRMRNRSRASTPRATATPKSVARKTRMASERTDQSSCRPNHTASTVSAARVRSAVRQPRRSGGSGSGSRVSSLMVMVPKLPSSVAYGETCHCRPPLSISTRLTPLIAFSPD